MPADNIFLDANIVLEILLGREKDAVARKIVGQHADSLHISALTAHLAVHFGQAIVTLPVLRQFLADYTVLPLDAADFEWAFANVQNSDFEDAVQLGTAIRCGCAQFITFDKALFKTYKNLPSISVRLAK